MKEVCRAVHGKRRYVRYSGERTYKPKAYSLISEFLKFKGEKGKKVAQVTNCRDMIFSQSVLLRVKRD